MENTGTLKNILIVILIAVTGYFAYSAYNAEDQLIAQSTEIKNLNSQLTTLSQKVSDYEESDAKKKAIVAELETKVMEQSKDLEDLKAQLTKSKEIPKAKKK